MIIYKCACCGKVTELAKGTDMQVYFSRQVKQSLGEYVCLHCEIEREYEIEAMQQARDNQ